MIYDYFVFLGFFFFENILICLKRCNKVFLLNIIINDFKNLMYWIKYLKCLNWKYFVKEIFK